MTERPTPKLSIIIPVYNRAHQISSTLASIPVDEIALAGETEIIVVDDGSSDGSVVAAEEFRAHSGLDDILTVLRQENAGPGVARNTGAAHAKGDLLIFLDSDDLWRPETLQAIRHLHATASDLALGFLRTIDLVEAAAAEALDITSQEVTFTQMSGFLEAATTPGAGSHFASCNVMIPRALFNAVGGFTKHVRCSEDTDLFLRLNDKGSCWMTEGPVLVAHIVGAEDRLSRNGPCVRGGLSYLMDQARRGAYVDQATGNRLNRFLAKSIVYTCRVSFAAGQIGAAYGLLLRHLARLWRGGQTRWIWRLALYPALARLRPQSYPIDRS